MVVGVLSGAGGSRFASDAMTSVSSSLPALALSAQLAQPPFSAGDSALPIVASGGPVVVAVGPGSLAGGAGALSAGNAESSCEVACATSTTRPHTVMIASFEGR